MTFNLLHEALTFPSSYCANYHEKKMLDAKKSLFEPGLSLYLFMLFTIVSIHNDVFVTDELKMCNVGPDMTGLRVASGAQQFLQCEMW